MTTFQAPLPPPDLSPNKRCHWAVKDRWTGAYRSDVFRMALKARGRERDIAHPKVRVSLTFCIKGGKGRYYQPRDENNAVAAFKAGFDGIVDAGWCKDDSAEYMELGPVRITAERGPFVEVTVEPCA